jgi:hypothetical protein
MVVRASMRAMIERMGDAARAWGRHTTCATDATLDC